MGQDIGLQSREGFSRLYYEGKSENLKKPSLTLYLPIKNEAYAGLAEVEAMLVPAEKTQHPNHIEYSISGTRKIYQALQWLSTEYGYSWNPKNRDPFNNLIKKIEKDLQAKPLPAYTFWTRTFKPELGLHDLDKHLTQQITVERGERGERVFSKKIEIDSKVYEDIQISSIYDRAFIGERASLDFVLFDEKHARKRLNSLEIENFTSMARLKKANKLPSPQEFVKKGAARLDVTDVFGNETDASMYNYGLDKDGNLVKIDHDHSAWDWICRYYGADPNLPYIFSQKLNDQWMDFVARSPAQSFQYSVRDIANLPFVEDAEFINSRANSFLGKYHYEGDFTFYLRGIHRHPDYLREKFQYFLKGVLFPDSFHEKVAKGFMSFSENHIQERIDYRKRCFESVKEPLFACNDFWLYVHEHPEWINEIQAQFSGFNQEMYQFFAASELMDLGAVESEYKAIVSQCAERVFEIVPLLLKEIEFLIKIYQNLSDEKHKVFVAQLKVIVEKLNAFLNNESTEIPIDFLNNAKYEIYQMEIGENHLSLLENAILFINHKNTYGNNNSNFDLLECVFLNNVNKLQNGIAMNYIDSDKLQEKTPLGMTALELALGYGHQIIAEKLFRLEDELSFTPPFGFSIEISQAAHLIRAAAKEYFFEICEIQNRKLNNSLFGFPYSLERPMSDIFRLFQALKVPVENVEGLKYWVNQWIVETKKGIEHNELCEKVVGVMASIADVSQDAKDTFNENTVVAPQNLPVC
jgi:hypothetical protein